MVFYWHRYVSGGEGQDFSLSEYAKLFGVDVRTSKQYGHPLVSGIIKAAYPKCDFG